MSTDTRADLILLDALEQTALRSPTLSSNGREQIRQSAAALRAEIGRLARLEYGSVDALRDAAEAGVREDAAGFPHTNAAWAVSHSDAEVRRSVDSSVAFTAGAIIGSIDLRRWVVDDDVKAKIRTAHDVVSDLASAIAVREWTLAEEWRREHP